MADDWDHYRSFLAVVRERSLSAAARALELTQPTLGRHIAALEASLRVKLFTRSQAGLRPTVAALEVVAHAEAMALSAEALQRAASGDVDEPNGTVRVTASEMIGVEVLPPILTAFRQAHPGIEIELALSNANQDLLRREADIAVRMIAPRQKALVAAKLGDVKVGLFGHQRYLAEHGIPRRLEDLRHHAMIGFDADSSALRALRMTALPVSRDAFAFRSDSEHAQLAMLRAGFGLAGAQIGIAARDPNLVRVLPAMFEFPLQMWLVMHEDLRDTRRIRLLYDHLAAGLRVYLGNVAVPVRRGAKKSR